MSHGIVCEDVLPVLKADFGNLWNCRQRGNSLEIITPFSTVTEKFVSVFITKRTDTFIVSDGGWLTGSPDYYQTDQDQQEEEFSGILSHYSHAFGISEAKQADGGVFYFKKCDKLALLSSAVYDVANFVATVVNGSSLQLDAGEEFDHQKTFRREANEFLKSRLPEARANQSIDGLDGVRFNAVLIKRSKLFLVSYVTGCTPYHFSKDLSRSIVNFELANGSKSAPFIQSRIALLNDRAAGYDPNRNGDQIKLLEKHRGRALRWEEREALVTVLQE